MRECYRALLAGTPISELVRDLNARGAVGERAALPVSGAPWRRGVFIRSMCRPALAGLLAHKGEVVGEIANAEPVVSREDRQRLCALADSRKVGRPPSPRHVLSGLVLCAACGGAAAGLPARCSASSSQSPPQPPVWSPPGCPCTRRKSPCRAVSLCGMALSVAGGGCALSPDEFVPSQPDNYPTRPKHLV